MIGLLIMGIGIGFFIGVTAINIDERKIKEELEYQEEYIKELQEKVDYYKDGWNETLEQNLYLKKKLGRYES